MRPQQNSDHTITTVEPRQSSTKSTVWQRRVETDKFAEMAGKHEEKTVKTVDVIEAVAGKIAQHKNMQARVKDHEDIESIKQCVEQRFQHVFHGQGLRTTRSEQHEG